VPHNLFINIAKGDSTHHSALAFFVEGPFLVAQIYHQTNRRKKRKRISREEMDRGSGTVQHFLAT
jgi:hypothetical protein